MTDKKILKYYVHTLCVGISYGVPRPTQGMRRFDDIFQFKIFQSLFLDFLIIAINLNKNERWYSFISDMLFY